MRAFVKSLNLTFLFHLNSLLWANILRIRGVKVGKNFYCEGSIYLKLNGNRFSAVAIGDNVKLYGFLDLRTREEGSIYIGNNVDIDSNVRLVAARNGTIEIGDKCSLGYGLIVNAGANVQFGKSILVGPNVLVQSSNHVYEEFGDIMGKGYVHEPVSIGKGSWLAANVVLVPGVTLEEGVVVGSSSVVTKDFSAGSIIVGVPARILKVRSGYI